MIVDIEAKFACDVCGTEFVVKIDPAAKSFGDGAIMELAEDFIRRGDSYRDGFEDVPCTGGSVGDDGSHFCQRCTKKIDSEYMK